MDELMSSYSLWVWMAVYACQQPWSMRKEILSIGNEKEETWPDKCCGTGGDMFVAENEAA